MKEIDVGSLVIDETRNCKELMSFIAKIWNLDQCSKPIIPNDVKMFRSEFLDTLKIYIVS